MQITEVWYEQEVNLAMQGDRGAYAKLIQHSMSTVTSIALSIVKDIDSSEDVAQKVYISIWEKLPTLKNPASFLAWVRQTTRHAAFNYLRDKKRAEVSFFDENRSGGKLEIDTLLVGLEDENSDLESIFSRQQQSDIIADVISQLPDSSREVIILYYREEQSTKQVAKLLDLSEANVRQRLARARVCLKDELLSRYGELLLTTVPPIGFATIISSSLMGSSPVMALGTVAALGNKSSVVAKLILLFGGATIGALGGLLGLYFGIAPAIKKAPCEILKQRLKRLRTLTAIWIVTSVVVLVVSFELSSGWMWPLFSFVVFYLGITAYVCKIFEIIYSDEFKLKFSSSQLMASKIGGLAGYVIGGLCGLGGLVWRLIADGRLAF